MSVMPVSSPAPIEPWEVLDLLTSLVQKSLVVFEEDEQGGGRYRLLETVRQYSRDRLVEAGSGETPRERHLQFCLLLAEEAELRLRGFEQKGWAARLESEHDNLRAALEWAIDRDPEAALRLSGALWWFWYMRGHVNEGRDWLARALDLAPVPGNHAANTARARALTGSGLFAIEQGQPTIGRAHLEESLAIYRGLDDLPGCALALALLGIPIVVESPAGARALGEESLVVARQLDEPWHLGWALLLLGEVARAAGDLDRAAAYYEEAAAAHRQIGEEWLLGCSLHNLGCVRLRQGDSGRARALLGESLVLFREQRSVVGMANCVAGLARSSAVEGQPARAARLFGAAEGLFDSIAQKMQPVDQAEFDRSVAAVRTLMGEEAFARARAEGRAMPLEEAIRAALAAE